MTGTRAMSGSVASRLRKRTMAASPSSMPSSKLTSIIWAPFSTCCAAMRTPSSKLPSMISLRKRAEPVTLVRSPTLTKLVKGVIASGSSPLKRDTSSIAGMARGCRCSTAWAMARMCSGVVPQQPPTMLTKPLWANSAR